METIGGRFRLEQQIAAGGEARVWLAEDLTAGTKVAVRLQNPPRGGAAALQMPTETPPAFSGWVRRLTQGVDPAHGPYLVFEFLKGETFAAKTARGPLAQPAWLDFVRQSLAAVDELHRAGWIHGDLNAENFLFAGTTWKLLDLPFNRFVPAPERPTLFGSIYTLAPERFAGRPPDAASDLYALGCLYHAAALGTYPHSGGGTADIAVGRLRFPPEAPADNRTDLPPFWVAWMMRLLEREPSARPAGAVAAREMLEAAATPPGRASLRMISRKSPR